MTAAMIVVAALGDPMAMLTGLQSRLRDAGTETREDGIELDRSTTERADQERARHLERAERAAKKAMNRAPRWVKKLISAVIAIAGAVASAFTAGVAAGLAVAAIVLMVAGEVVQALADHGVINGKVGQWTAFTLKLAGAILMTVASGGAGAGGIAQTATTAAKVAKDVVTYVHATVDMVIGSRTIAQSVHNEKATQANLSASVEEERADEHRDSIDVSIQEIREIATKFGRVIERIRATQETQGSVRLETARAIA